VVGFLFVDGDDDGVLLMMEMMMVGCIVFLMSKLCTHLERGLL